MNTATNFGQNQQQSNNFVENCCWLQPIRQWSHTSFGRNFRYNNRHATTFVLMSYNILAQSLLLKHPYLYNHHNTNCLDWLHRLTCIQREIFTVCPGILCLQEVQDNHLAEIEQALQPLNYTKPLYKQRTGRDYDDGCAIFYNPELFTLLDYHYVEYYQPNIDKLDRCNVAIIAKFASKRVKNQEMIVATTHLLYNPRRDDVRIAQLQVLLAELDRMSVHTETQQPLPIILTGDFNCLPHSNPIRLINDGHIHSDNLPIELGIMDDCQHINVSVHKNRTDTDLYHSDNGKNSSEESVCDQINYVDAIHRTEENMQKHGVPYNTGALWHYLNFTPTLDVERFSGKIASTYQNEWIMVDYIFYTKHTRRTLGPVGQPPEFSSLQLLANYQLPSIRECQMIGPIPNEIYGSDHYAMASEFVLLTR